MGQYRLCSNEHNYKFPEAPFFEVYAGGNKREPTCEHVSSLAYRASLNLRGEENRGTGLGRRGDARVQNS
jgi:hypothetical protein